MNKNVVLSAVAIVLLMGGFFFYQSSSPVVPVISEPQVEVSEVTKCGSDEKCGTSEEQVITLTATGYSPASLTIKKGETVVFKNESSESNWPASAMHPSHVVYSGTSLLEHCPDAANTSFDSCKGYLQGQLWLFTFEKVGSWKYHNHLNSRQYGSITVE